MINKTQILEYKYRCVCMYVYMTKYLALLGLKLILSYHIPILQLSNSYSTAAPLSTTAMIAEIVAHNIVTRIMEVLVVLHKTLKYFSNV